MSGIITNSFPCFALIEIQYENLVIRRYGVEIRAQKLAFILFSHWVTFELGY